MIKWMKPAAAAVLLVGALIGVIPATYAASSATTEVFIDGKLQENPIVSQRRTLVQLIAFSDPSWVSYSYEVKTKTVVISNPANKITIRLKEGEKQADVNGTAVKLDAPVTMKSGHTYVPLRFLSETLGGKIDYNSKTNHTIVRTPFGGITYQKLMSGSLSEARNAAIGLARVAIKGMLEPTGEGFAVSRIFPKGQALRFNEDYKGLISYIEVSTEGIAEVKWQKDTFSETGKFREVGTKPKAFGTSYYFTLNAMYPEFSEYGSIEADGTSKLLGHYDVTKERLKKGEIIEPIAGEKRTDGITK